MDEHLVRLYNEFDRLYRGIISTCAGCPDHDCEGFVWLLPAEADALSQQGIEIIEINDDLSFIHSFEEEDGEILIGKAKPPCYLRRDSFCSVYDNRPLTCRMYPVGLASQEGVLMLVLHQDCQFSRNMSGDEKALFLRGVLDILRSVPRRTIKEIADTFKRVDEISVFPDGPNLCEPLISIEDILSNE